MVFRALAASALLSSAQAAVMQTKFVCGQQTTISIRRRAESFSSENAAGTAEFSETTIEERNRETFSQVSNDIKRISGQISDLRRKQIGANEMIRSLGRSCKEIIADKGKAELECEQVRLEEAADLALKEDDLAVFDFILQATKCVGEDAAAFVQVNHSQSPLVCSTDNEHLELRFDDPKQQAKLDKMLTARTRKTLHQALASMVVVNGNFLQLKETQGATSTINTTTVVVPTSTVAQEPVKEEPPAGGQWKKCTNRKPNCGLLHDTMSIQWGIFRDLADELKYEVGLDKAECDATSANLNEQLVIVGEAKTKNMELLMQTIGNIQEDSQEQSEKQEPYRDLDRVYKNKVAECTMQIEEILFTNICAVRQIRDKLMSYSEVSPPAAIMDWGGLGWSPEDCGTDPLWHPRCR